MIQFDSHSRGFAVVVVVVVVIDVVIVIEFDDKCGVITESDDA